MTKSKSAKTAPEQHVFEADVSRLLHMMVHSVYSDKDVFLRELISNAADACEKLRYEAIGAPELYGDDATPRIMLTIDKEAKRLTIDDNGIGMTRQDMVDALGTIARSGTKAFMEQIEAAQKGGDATLIGQFGVGFYSAFMVAERVDVLSRRAGSDEAWQWSSDGKGTFEMIPLVVGDAPVRGTRVVLHLLEDALSYAEKYTLERMIRAQSGHVPVPIQIMDTGETEASEVTDGAALWTKSKADISAQDYTDFYRSVAGVYDEPASTLHYRAEGRQEYTVLTFIPGSKPFDLFDADRKGRIKLYVKRVFITDEAEILPRYLRFVRGLVDSADLPLNVSREMIQESVILTAIKRGVTGRVIGDLEKIATNEPETYAAIWANFGPVLKEGIYEDYERRDALLGLSRFATTSSGESLKSLPAIVEGFKDNQTAIYYIAGDDRKRLESSPHLEGFKARGIEVLFLTDPVDSFWVSSGVSFEGKPFKSVTQGASDLSLIPLLDSSKKADQAGDQPTIDLISFFKDTLGEAVSDVRISDRLTDSAVCIVASEQGPDRQLEKMLMGAGRIETAAKPVLEINPQHDVIRSLAGLDTSRSELKQDAAHLLLDEALILDGERPTDPKNFSDRLARILRQSIG